MPKVDDELWQAFKGKEILAEPLHDDWGTWVSTLEPLQNPVNGEAQAVLGIDYNIIQWNGGILSRTLQAIIIVAGLLLLLFTIWKLMGKQERLLEESPKLKLAVDAGNIEIWSIALRENRLIWDERTYMLYGLEPGTPLEGIASWKKILDPDDNDWPLYILGVNFDITKGKQMEQELKENAAKFSGAFHSGSTAMALVKSKEGTYIDFNEAFLNMLGYSEEEIRNQKICHLQNRVNSEDWRKMRQIFKAGGQIKNMEVKIDNPNGLPHTVLLFVDPIEVSQHPCWRISLIDISKRKEMEQEPLWRENLLKLMTIHSLLGFWLLITVTIRSFITIIVFVRFGDCRLLRISWPVESWATKNLSCTASRYYPMQRHFWIFVNPFKM
ncbi:MAG TPA: hypothetical protein DDW50_15255 [Firmicutes bacterium]|jgi:PAS domain S-box-containing protein|nr:hypothetical protein [Bacillota bacterium]